MFQSHIERFSPCRGGPQVCCARPDRERQRPGLRLTPGVTYRWNPDLSMRRRFKRMMGRARGRRIGVRHFLPRMKWTTTTTTRAGCLLRKTRRFLRGRDLADLTSQRQMGSYVREPSKLRWSSTRGHTYARPNHACGILVYCWNFQKT